MANKSDFITAYAANMKANSGAHPGEYLVPASWEALAEKMFNSIVAGTANVSDMAKKTAKAFGAKPTVGGVTELCKSLNA